MKAPRHDYTAWAMGLASIAIVVLVTFGILHRPW